MGPSPLAQLTRAVEGFICKLCRESKRFTESANRTAANELDVACAYIRIGAPVVQNALQRVNSHSLTPFRQATTSAR